MIVMIHYTVLFSWIFCGSSFLFFSPIWKEKEERWIV